MPEPNASSRLELPVPRPYQASSGGTTQYDRTHDEQFEQPENPIRFHFKPRGHRSSQACSFQGGLMFARFPVHTLCLFTVLVACAYWPRLRGNLGLRVVHSLSATTAALPSVCPGVLGDAFGNVSQTQEDLHVSVTLRTCGCDPWLCFHEVARLAVKVSEDDLVLSGA